MKKPTTNPEQTKIIRSHSHCLPFSPLFSMSFVCHSHSFAIRALPKPAFVKDFTLSFEHNFYSALEIFEVPVSAIVIASTLDLLINPNNFHCTYLFRQQSPNGRTDFFALWNHQFIAMIYGLKNLRKSLKNARTMKESRTGVGDKNLVVLSSLFGRRQWASFCFSLFGNSKAEVNTWEGGRKL